MGGRGEREGFRLRFRASDSERVSAVQEKQTLGVYCTNTHEIQRNLKLEAAAATKPKGEADLEAAAAVKPKGAAELEAAAAAKPKGAAELEAVAAAKPKRGGRT